MKRISTIMLLCAATLISSVTLAPQAANAAEVQSESIVVDDEAADVPAAVPAKKFNYDLYGFVRTDFFYNSRDCLAPFNDIFYLMPYDVELDPAGEDINDTSSAGVFAFITRVGLDIKGPKVGKATTTAKIEMDFGGYSDYNFLLRLRHAYVNMNWEEKCHTLIVGQTWHPLFGTVMPYISNVSTGAPFQPFARSPQLRYEYRTNGWVFLAAALYQMQYTSSGPIGSTNDYQIDSCIPELYGGFDYYSDGGFQFGGGIYSLSLAPRNTSEVGGATYKVDELMTAVSGEVHLRYNNGKLNIGAQSIYASALDGMAMMGGYGVTSISGENEQQEYTALHNSTTWLNITYGTVWKPSIFVGYTKNLGSNEALISADKIYGRGIDVDQLLGLNVGLTYNKPSWSVGVEGGTSTAWYGDLDLATGRVSNTHDVTNLRIVGNMTYFF